MKLAEMGDTKIRKTRGQVGVRKRIINIEVCYGRRIANNFAGRMLQKVEQKIRKVYTYKQNREIGQFKIVRMN